MWTPSHKFYVIFSSGHWHLPRYPLRSLLYVVVSRRHHSHQETVYANTVALTLFTVALIPVTFFSPTPMQFLRCMAFCLPEHCNSCWHCCSSCNSGSSIYFTMHVSQHHFLAEQKKVGFIECFDFCINKMVALGILAT